MDQRDLRGAAVRACALAAPHWPAAMCKLQRARAGGDWVVARGAVCGQDGPHGRKDREVGLGFLADYCACLR